MELESDGFTLGVAAAASAVADHGLDLGLHRPTRVRPSCSAMYSSVNSLVLLRPGEAYARDGRDEIVWEHGRRNFELRADGLLSIVGPVPDEGDLRGLAIFATSPDETRRLMADDPAVQAGIFTVEVHGFRSFPGDALA